MSAKAVSMLRPVSIATIIFVLLSQLCFAATFESLIDVSTGVSYNPHAISADGETIVGFSYSAQEAFVWTADGGMTLLGDLPGSYNQYSRALGVSADGSVVVGLSAAIDYRSRDEAFIWTAGGGMVSLGDLPGSIFNSEARGVSADGSIVVGQARSANGPEAFRWTAAGGMVGLGDLPGGGWNSEANAISADGNVIVGSTIGPGGKRQAFRWTAAEGMTGLGFLADGDIAESSAAAVSADGSVIVGYSHKADAEGRTLSRPFRWTAAEGMVEIGHLGYDYPGRATGVSADGSVISVWAGRYGGIDAAFIWTATGGLQTLRSTLINNGAFGLEDWSPLGQPIVAADGVSLTGFSRNNAVNGNLFVGFVANIEPDFNIEIDFDAWQTANTVRPKDAYFVAVGIRTLSILNGDAVNFDPGQIDPASIKLGPDQAPNVADPANPLWQDIDNDGDLDLVVGFRVENTGIGCLDNTVNLIAKSWADESLVGQDLIVPIGCDETIAIDVAPASATNPIRPNDSYDVTVAVLGMRTSYGDAVNVFIGSGYADDIDPNSLSFGPAGTGITAAPVIARVNNDLFDDMLVTFNAFDAGIACGDTELEMTGEKISGIPVVAVDSIVTEDCDTGGCHP
jgi:probable HAF family extracellular repeat protein